MSNDTPKNPAVEGDTTKKVDFEVDELTDELEHASGGLAESSCANPGCHYEGGCSGCS